MLNKHNKTGTAALLAALCFTLSFSSCKKKDGDPSPTNPSGTLKCRPVSEQDLSTNEVRHTFQYDSQKRVEKIISNTSFGAYDMNYTATVTYNPDGSVDVLPSNTLERTRHVITGGRFIMSLTGNEVAGDSLFARFDTAFYDYQNGKITDIRFRKRTLGESQLYANYSQHIDYDGAGLPSVVTDLDDNGVALVRTTYTYDTREVSYNTFSPFSIAPGLEIIKVNRMFKKVTRDDILPPSTDTDGESSFLNEYDGDKPHPVKVTVTGSGWTYLAGIITFSYNCD